MIDLPMVLRQSLAREWCLQGRQLHGLASNWLFYAMILLFFPLAFPADDALLLRIAPGIIWISVLFAFFLAAERLFVDEEQDGVLEQWLLEPEWLVTQLYAKLIIHWLVHLLPMLLCGPLLALVFHIPWFALAILSIALILGTPAIFLCCALAAAFSTGVAQKSVFMALIILPLTLPILILGSGTLTAALQGLAVSSALALLLAISLVAGLILPMVVAWVIRLQVN